MGRVTISPKFQVVIPKEIREKLGLSPGQRVEAIAYENRIELIRSAPSGRCAGFSRASTPRLSGKLTGHECR